MEVHRYIADFPNDVEVKLEEIRSIILDVLEDEAEEKMSYGIPTFVLNGNLVHYGGFKQHIGFYPGASGIEHFKKDLSGYKFAKGSVQFPVEKELPMKLIQRIVKFRIMENLEKAKAKKKKKK